MFKTASGKKIPDINIYIKEYLAVHNDEKIDIIIGCDSQTYGRFTFYATVVVLYKEGHGGHVLYQKEKTECEKVRSVRLMNEVWKSVSVAEELRKNGIKKAKYIDIDINPCEKYKSNEVFNAAVGMVKGMGYDCRCKTLGAAVTYCADHIVRQ